MQLPMKLKRTILFFIVLSVSSLAWAGSSTIYPNPTYEGLTLESNGDSEIVRAEVYNYLGSKVAEYTGSASMRSEIDLSQLQAGKYFVKIFYADGTGEIQQVVKK